MKVVTYNIRCVYLHEVDGLNSFLLRSGMMLDKISKESPDIICFQEVEAKILGFLKRNLTDYDIYGHGREIGRIGEGVYIAVKKNEFTLLSFNTFWLSPTPDVPGSRFQNQSNCPRICPVAVFMSNKTGKIIRVVGIHLDYISDSAAKLGMDKVLEYLPNAEKTLPADMTFMLGDFNVQPDSETIKTVNSFKAIPLVDATKESGFTFHNFGRYFEKDSDVKPIKIDYIFVSKEKADLCHDLKVWDDCNFGIYLSDHYPVEITVDI